MRLEKVVTILLFSAFFLWLHFTLRSWAVGQDSASSLCNPAGAFGIPVPVWVLGGLGAGIVTYAYWQGLVAAGRLTRIAWLLIGFGGLGNLLERQRFGCIMDYVALPGLPWFPIFNIADIWLTLGVLGLLWKSVGRNTTSEERND